MQGTSMASPHAAGAAAIAAGLQPGWDATALKAALLGGADPVPALAGRGVTGARLDAAGTAALAAGRAPGAPDRSAFEPTSEVPPPDGAPAAHTPARSAGEPRVRRLRVRGRPRVCRGATGCRARTATLSFSLDDSATVTTRLERRRCRRPACAWVRTGRRTRRAAAGTTRWTVGARLLGMRLRPARWRVAVTAPGGTARRAFTVGGR
jgi:hypothetical protein